MGYTTDPTDERLGHGVDDEPIPQHEVYLILSDEERAKGFVRPLRRAYKHVGPPGPTHELRDLTPEEDERYERYGYVKFEAYPPSDESSVVGRFWTEKMLGPDAGCGVVTTMSHALCETYARDPKFYGATYCCHCSKHLPVNEFVWVEDNERVGS